MKTRAEAIRAYVDRLGPNVTSAMQALAFQMFCEELEHIGYMTGYQQCSIDTSIMLGGTVRPQFPPDVADPLDPVDVPR